MLQIQCQYPYYFGSTGEKSTLFLQPLLKENTENNTDLKFNLKSKPVIWYSSNTASPPVPFLMIHMVHKFLAKNQM